MSLKITYYTQSVTNPNALGLPILTENLAASGTTAASAVTPGGASTIRIRSSAANNYAYSGPASVATAAVGANGHPIAVDEVIDIQAVPGWKIAVITAS